MRYYKCKKTGYRAKIGTRHRADANRRY
eukprot:SAG11_NODE_45523_length_144_cov_14.333333_1_plen_27_part_10